MIIVKAKPIVRWGQKAMGLPVFWFKPKCGRQIARLPIRIDVYAVLPYLLSIALCAHSLPLTLL